MSRFIRTWPVARAFGFGAITCAAASGGGLRDGFRVFLGLPWGFRS